MVNIKNKNSILAVVVSYNGIGQLTKNVRSLITQVTDLVIVDNGSNNETLEEIKAIQSNWKIRVIYLNKNCGIGVALNAGINMAISEGFDWVLTMDQDSIAGPNMVNAMLTSASKIRNKICMLAPSISLLENKGIREKDKEVNYAITSGNLVPVQCYIDIGLYNEKYFIDSVDFEFCLRAKNSSVLIINSAQAELIHQLGKSVKKNIFNFTWIYIEHIPLRRYYIYRNHLYLMRDFIKSNPKFILLKTANILIYSISIILFDSNRLENINMIKRGIFDFFRGITGPFNNKR